MCTEWKPNYERLNDKQQPFANEDLYWNFYFWNCSIQNMSLVLSMQFEKGDINYSNIYEIYLKF